MLGKELLEGEHIHLTAVQKSDIPDMLVWYNDVEFQRLLRRGMVTPHTQEGMEHWITHQHEDRDSFLFGIRTLSEQRFIGMIGVKDIFWQARHCELWIGIGEASMRGKGYGTDAMRVILKFAFMEMNMNRVGLVVASYNPRARASYEKCGFKLEGTLRDYFFRDGEYHDLYVMGLLRRDWEQM